MSLENFEGPSVTFKSSGALYTVQVNIFCEVVHRMLADDQWSQALKICRRCQVKSLNSARILGEIPFDRFEVCFLKSKICCEFSKDFEILFYLL